MKVTVSLTKREAEAFMLNGFEHPYGVRKSQMRQAAEMKIATAIASAQADECDRKAAPA